MTDDTTVTKSKPATLLAQAVSDKHAEGPGIIPPLYVSTTYVRDADNEYSSGLSYGRPHNPTVQHVESVLAKLELGADAMLFGSGMAAATAVFQSLKPGDHVIAPKVMYWSLRNWLAGMASDWGLQVDFVDMSDLDAIAACLQAGKTRLVWIETPANPLWSITDIRAVCDMAHVIDARVVVDSTVVTPILSQPLSLGADIVMHSATKYLNGHTDVLAGALVTAKDDDFWVKIQQLRSDLGGILSPRDASQLLRGLRTLHLRVRESSASAMAIALHFERHPKLSSVLYPGLQSHPGHEIACKQMSGGFGGMLSLRVAAGRGAAVEVAAGVKLWKRATSLGGVESLIEHRASIEGEGTPVPENLLRLSTGIEDVGDLIRDLEQAIGF